MINTFLHFTSFSFRARTRTCLSWATKRLGDASSTSCAFSILGVLSVISCLTSSAFAQDPQPYPTVGPRTGVYEDGQAALWDLDFLDSYRLFGAEERANGYAPQQPIKFSHVRHVQLNKMECQYCHWTVNKSEYAAIPEVETCIGCHKMVLGTEDWQKAEIQKLQKYFTDKNPIPWEKVHVMPDHVRFNHKRHVKAGVSCQQCHGQIPEMPVVERVSSMKMGWCISCHREKGTSIDCSTCHK